MMVAIGPETDLFFYALLLGIATQEYQALFVFYNNRYETNS